MEDTKLGFGMMNQPRMNAADDGSAGLKEMNEMVDLFLKKGFTYFDASYVYYGQQSEKTAGECLVKRHPREWFTLASKLHYAYFNTAEEADAVFEEQRRNAGVERFDYYMLHDIDEKSIVKYERLKCFDWLTAKKKQGQIKYMGFSFKGDIPLLERLLNEHAQMHFVQINMKDKTRESMDAAMDVFECAAKHGIGVIVTSEDPEVIRYCMGFPEVYYTVAGIESMKLLKELTAD